MSVDELNDDQRRALACSAPRVVINAGAGSGKTRVLAERFADVVVQAEASGVARPITSALLITFTEKAAGELTERVRRVFIERGRPDLGRSVDDAWISTIHGFCARIVRRHAFELGIDPGFAVLADPAVGLTRSDAFETAARQRIARDVATVDLLESHGVEAIRETIVSAYDTVRSKGATVDAVRVGRAPDVASSITACGATLDALIPRYAELASSPTAEDNLAGYRACREMLTELEHAEPDRAASVLAASAGGYLGSLRAGASVRDLTEEVNAVIGTSTLDAADAAAAAQGRTWLALLAAYEVAYDAAKRVANALDFDDLQLLAARLWRERPGTARRYRALFAEVMVDEFQDTTAAQLQAIEPVVATRLCVVGDVQQSIYRFRDSDVGVFISERQRAADCDGRCDLTVNYRSEPGLLDGLNDLFGRPHLLGDAHLGMTSGAEPAPASAGARRPPIDVILVDRNGLRAETWRAAEAAALASRLRELVDEGVAAADEIALLVRSTTTMRPYVDALLARGFDVFAGAAGGFHDSPEIADIRALMRVLADPLDDEGLLRLLAGGLGGLSDDSLFLLNRRPGALWRALEDPAPAGLSEREAARVESLRATIDRVRAEMGRKGLADAILDAAAALGPVAGGFSAVAWANVRKAARLAAEAESAGDGDPEAFLRHLEDREAYVKREPAAGPAAGEAGAVRVMTVHAAKGLEFPVVAVADLGHDQRRGFARFLVGRGLDGDPIVAVRGAGKSALKPRDWSRVCDAERADDLAESKRVFYVACSRARRLLVLSGATDPASEPDPERAIDWVRLALDGPDGVRGVSVRRVVAGDEEPSSAGAPRAASPAVRAAPVPPRPACTAAEAARPAFVPQELSYTALSLYGRCPYRFYMERVVGLRGLGPAPETDPRAFGTALHAALQLFAEGEALTDETVRRLSAAHRLGPEGLARLRKAVAATVRSPLAASIRAGRPEAPFAIRVGAQTIVGTVDLLVRENGSCTVLDYKTGESGARAAVLEEQAGIYALALLEDGAATVEVRFIEIEHGLAKTVFRFGEHDRDRLVARIQRQVALMEAGCFERRGSFDADVCPECAVPPAMCPVRDSAMRAARGARRPRGGARA